MLRWVMTFAVGLLVVTGAAATYPQVQELAQFEAAGDHDAITMITVPVAEDRLLEAVFVLNHRTGVLTGNAINGQNGRFNYSYSRNLTADFFPSAKTPPPESIFKIVAGPVDLPLYGSVQQAFGVIYVAEVSRGGVIAYRFPRPLNAGTSLRLEKIDQFTFQ
jgi:hypothetical protein